MAATPTLVKGDLPRSDAQSERRRWLALICIAVAQLMIALDATVVNIALPSVQAALEFSDADRQWIVSAYTLAFGGLLLLGGRIADSVKVGPRPVSACWLALERCRERSRPCWRRRRCPCWR
jgi:MFS family permease